MLTAEHRVRAPYSALNEIVFCASDILLYTQWERLSQQIECSGTVHKSKSRRLMSMLRQGEGFRKLNDGMIYICWQRASLQGTSAGFVESRIWVSVCEKWRNAGKPAMHMSNGHCNIVLEPPCTRR